MIVNHTIEPYKAKLVIHFFLFRLNLRQIQLQIKLINSSIYNILKKYQNVIQNSNW
jgi:hypothetical protein